jgi:alginate O-acetyltransferase complex protein AlgI
MPWAATIVSGCRGAGVQCVGVAQASVNASFSMLFNSWNFLVFMAVLLPLYYAPSASAGWQLALLLAASAVFYAWESPWLLGLLIGSSSVSVFAAQQIVANRWAAPSPGAQPSGTLAAARRWLWLGVSINLLALLLFKYAPLLSALAPEWMLPSPARDWALAIPLPVGISFYTFQGISLIVDAWRGDLPAATKASLAAHGLRRSTSFRDATFYLLFFPQLVAGPIVKAHDFLPQIGRKTRRDIDWLTARRALVTGFFLKMVVADNLAEQTVPLALGTAGDMSMGALNLLALIYAYSLQIFADFAGYSLIAIGLSSLFGYTLSANFNFPYLATTITDFWRRWHLSLSSWLREYLYIPLGGNRRGDVRTYVNLFIVMFLGGLWHGAAWKYALWGTLHGVFLAVERLVSRFRRAPASGSTLLATAAPVFGWFFTFHVVTLLWLTFVMPDLHAIEKCLRAVACDPLGRPGAPVFALLFYGTPVALYHAWGALRERSPALATRLLNSIAEPVIHGIMVFAIVTNAGAPRGFIYFQF